MNDVLRRPLFCFSLDEGSVFRGLPYTRTGFRSVFWKEIGGYSCWGSAFWLAAGGRKALFMNGGRFSLLDPLDQSTDDDPSPHFTHRSMQSSRWCRKVRLWNCVLIQFKMEAMCHKEKIKQKVCVCRPPESLNHSMWPLNQLFSKSLPLWKLVLSNCPKTGVTGTTEMSIHCGLFTFPSNQLNCWS